MAIAPKRATGQIRFLDDDESRQFFDAQARRLMNMSGEEFLRRYDAGDFAEPQDDRQGRAVMKLVMLSSFGR
jgi:hypothetical protein